MGKVPHFFQGNCVWLVLGIYIKLMEINVEKAVFQVGFDLDLFAPGPRMPIYLVTTRMTTSDNKFFGRRNNPNLNLTFTWHRHSGILGGGG